MKFFLDFFPLAGFFIVYKLYDIIAATIALMILIIFQILGTWLLTKKVEKLQIATAVAALFFGGLTVGLQDPAFIKWKVSIISWLFFAIFAVRLLLLKKATLLLLFKQAIKDIDRVPKSRWLELDLVWLSYFLVFGFINLWIAFSFSETTWVNFKVWGLMLSQLVVFIYSIYRLMPYLDFEESTAVANPQNESSNQQD